MTDNTRRDFIKGVGVIGGAALASSSSVAATPDGLQGKFSGYIITHADRFEWSPSVDVIKYGSDGYPGWIIGYSDDEYAKVESWIDGSDDRTLIRHTAAKNRVVVAAPHDHLGVTAWARHPWNQDGIHTADWIEWIDVNRSLSVNPITALESEDVWEEPNGAYIAEFPFVGGEFSSDGPAYSDDAETASMSDIRTTINADSVVETGAGITVAVVDTGVNKASDDSVLNGQLVDGYNAITDTTTDAANSDFSAVEDKNGHGSFCASEVHQIAPDANIAPVKVLNDDGSGATADIVRGIEHAAETVGADVISMSLGSAFYAPPIDDAINQALRDHGVSAVVVAVGNSRMTTRWVASPADNDQVIGVAATNNAAPSEVKSAYFSCVGEDDGVSDASQGETRGRTPDIATVGMKVTTTVANPDGTTKTKELSGTSMAAPINAGAIALPLEADATLIGDHTRVRERVLECAVAAQNCGYTEVGSGILDVEKLVNNTRPDADQMDQRTGQAEQRDKANLALSGDMAGYLGITQRED